MDDLLLVVTHVAGMLVGGLLVWAFMRRSRPSRPAKRGRP